MLWYLIFVLIICYFIRVYLISPNLSSPNQVRLMPFFAQSGFSPNAVFRPAGLGLHALAQPRRVRFTRERAQVRLG